MSWDAIGAIGEIIGALAVVISLIYLSSQVRHNNRLASNASLQAVLQSEMDFASIVIDNAELWDKVIAGDPLEGREDNRKAIMLYNLYILDSAARYNQFKLGYLEEQNWESRKKVLHDIVHFPIFEKWRVSIGARSQSKEFIELIDSIREEEISK